MSSLLGRWLSHTTEHGCAGVDVKSMAPKGVNCPRPPLSLTRVIFDVTNRQNRWIGSAQAHHRRTMVGLSGHARLNRLELPQANDGDHHAQLRFLWASGVAVQPAGQLCEDRSRQRHLS